METGSKLGAMPVRLMRLGIRLKIKVNTHYPEIGEEIKKWVERDTQILGYNTQLANERKTNL